METFGRFQARTECGDIAKRNDHDLDLEDDEVMSLEMEDMSLEVQEIGRRQQINCRDTMTSRSRFQKDWQVRVKSRMKEQWGSSYHASHVEGPETKWRVRESTGEGTHTDCRHWGISCEMD